MAEAASSVREYALIIEGLEAQIADLNGQKSSTYKQAGNDDVNVPALRQAIALRRKQAKDPQVFALLDAKVRQYLDLLDEELEEVEEEEVADDASRARAREEEPKAKSTGKRSRSEPSADQANPS